MRRILQLVTASFLTLNTGLAGLASADEIGAFRVEVNGQTTVFISQIVMDENADDYYSDLSTMASGTTNTIRVEGSVAPNEPQPEFPYISLTIGGTSPNYTDFLNIQLIDASYGELLLSVENIGQRHIENLMVGNDGIISFDFSADLVRVNPENNIPIDGVNGAHIAGRYTGQIPASELKDQ